MTKKPSTLSMLALLPALWVLAAPGCTHPGPNSEHAGSSDPRLPGTNGWYESSTPIVKEYLTTLPETAIGQPLDGIRLSDGSRWFEGYTYLGRPPQLPEKLRVTLLRAEGRVLAFMWIEEDGEPFDLEPCEGEDAGIRARRLAGSVHAWRALRPEHGVVYTTCPPEAWLPTAADDE